MKGFYALWYFIKASLGNWYGGVSIFFGVLDMIKRLFHKKIPTWIPGWLKKPGFSLVVAIIIFIVAIFFAWKEQYDKANQLVVEKATLTQNVKTKDDEIKGLTKQVQELGFKNKQRPIAPTPVTSQNQQGGLTAGIITGGTFVINPPRSMSNEKQQKTQQQLNEWSMSLLKNCSKLKITFDEIQTVTLIKWSQQLAYLGASDTKPDLNKLLWHSYPRIPIEYLSRENELLAQAEFTLNCLETNEYIQLAKIDTVLRPWYQKAFQNVTIEFKDKWHRITQ